MSVTDKETVDAIGIDEASGSVVLTISDHLDWSEEQSHLLVLQEKINSYLRFIESGEIDHSYPEAVGKQRVIAIVLKSQPTETASAFIEKASRILGNSNIELRARVYAASEDP